VFEACVLGPKVLSIYSIHLISLFFLLYFLSIDFCNARLKKVGLSVVTQGQNVIRKRRDGKDQNTKGQESTLPIPDLRFHATNAMYS
jgi:hypothetical protein